MKNKYASGFLNVLLWASIAVYSLLLASLLLFKYVSPFELFSTDRYMFREVNFIPLVGIYEYLFTGKTSFNVALYNVLGNIAVFVPLGLLLRLLRPKQPFWRTVLIVCGISAAVEVLQFALGIGSADIDDVILNTLGGLLGALLFMLLHRLLKDRRRVRTAVSVLAALCAIAVMAFYGRAWYRTMFYERYRNETVEKYGMNLEDADIKGVYKSLVNNTMTLSLGQDSLDGELVEVAIGGETVISIVRYTQFGDIDVFEPIDTQFLSGMTPGLPVWVSLSGDGNPPQARIICMGDRLIGIES